MKLKVMLGAALISACVVGCNSKQTDEVVVDKAMFDTVKESVEISEDLSKQYKDKEEEDLNALVAGVMPEDVDYHVMFLDNKTDGFKAFTYITVYNYYGSSEKIYESIHTLENEYKMYVNLLFMTSDGKKSAFVDKTGNITQLGDIDSALKEFKG